MTGPTEPYTRLAGVYDELVVDPCYSSWADFLDRLWADDPAGVHLVLDACCGTGLLPAELLPRGYRIVGFDAAPAMLERARGLLGPGVPLLEATLPGLPGEGPLAGPFDAVVSTFDGLNYLTPADFHASVGQLARRLRPGGWLVFDLHTDAMMHFVHEHSVVDGEDGDVRFTITNEVDVAARTVATTLDLRAPDPARSFREEHHQYFHSDDAVEAAIADAGLLLVSRLDEYTDAPADDATVRATWVARRP